MFGSKLRSWMENHIVRPRKKGTKNKNANSNVAGASAAGCSHEVYKKTVATGFTIYHGNGSTIPTSTSASSVPASASHTANHSSAVISSPVRRREVSPIQNHTQSRYGWQSPDQETITSPKSDNFLYAPQHHRVIVAQHHTAPNSKENSCADKSGTKYQQQQQADCSSSSFSSLSWSTGSKEPSMHSTSNQQHMKAPSGHKEIYNTAATSASSFQLRDESFNDIKNLDDDINAVHYEEINTILRHPENIVNNHFVEPDRPKSDQLSIYAPVIILQEDKSQDDASTRYGRLLPSRIQPQGSSSADNLNANHSHSGSAECIPSNNNQRFAGLHYVHNSSALATHTIRSNRLRIGRYSGSIMHGTQCGGVANGLQHSLSSPESAYSTGYSTDGASPGAIYTPPEYYINMRTGTHYFPKSMNSLAIEAQRYKFGLNKIEEMSPIDPLPKTSFANVGGYYKRTDYYNEIQDNSLNYGATNQLRQMDNDRPLPHSLNVGCHSPLALRNTIVLPTLKGFESPSPRQRCRIRTNPWYSTTDTSSSGTTVGTGQLIIPTSSSSTISSLKSVCSTTARIMEVDGTSTSSSGIKSSYEAEGLSDKIKHLNGKASCVSSESSSSLTEVENMQRTFSPNTIRRKSIEPVAGGSGGDDGGCGILYTQCKIVADGSNSHSDGNFEFKDAVAAATAALLSDDDATLNEMMGKFDESYVYEKETDILSSDSDPTDCVSDLDTGQDAGDECDTDELLDIDFIDTTSIHEIFEREDSHCNLGSCYYYNNDSPQRVVKQHAEKHVSVHSRKNSRSFKTSQDPFSGGGPSSAGGSQRRRKRFMKTRKKSSDNRGDHFNSPVGMPRESRSAGGTPVCLRRNYSAVKERIYKTSPLSNRSSSLVFTDVHENHFMTIADSEKVLLKADIEADVKYRQLILEAESLLVSMKNSMQSIPRDTPVASPRRVNPIANKRVEMLKNCEVEAKRDYLKQQQQQQQRCFDATTHTEQELAAAINKRIEILKFETASVPNSPKFNRLSPRKTHLTNFINQNVPPDVAPIPMRKSSTSDYVKAPTSPQLQLNGRVMQRPNASPLQRRRRFRSQSPKMTSTTTANPTIIDSDSEPDCNNISKQLSSISLRNSYESIRNINFKSSAEDVINHNYLPEFDRIMLYDGSHITNRNAEGIVQFDHGIAKPTLMQFCPQSEPLKRKVYKGSTTFERIKKSFDLESEIPKQAMLAKIHLLRRRDRQNTSTSKLSSAKSSIHDLNHSTNNIVSHDRDNKKQIILNTIAELKRSLENQSVELNGLNED